MDTITLPNKVTFRVATYDGDWTAEEIEAGLAGEPRFEEQTFVKTPDGYEQVLEATQETAIEGD